MLVGVLGLGEARVPMCALGTDFEEWLIARELPGVLGTEWVIAQAERTRARS